MTWCGSISFIQVSNIVGIASCLIAVDMLSLRLMSLLTQFYRSSNQIFVCFLSFSFFFFGIPYWLKLSDSGLKNQEKRKNMDSSTFTSFQRVIFINCRGGDSSELEANLSLSDRLKIFKTSNFDPDAYVTTKWQRLNIYQGQVWMGPSKAWCK